MIRKLISFLLLINVLIINCVNVRAFNNKTIADNYANSSALQINISQQHFSLMNSKSRVVRGVQYNHPFEEHEYHEHESIIEPQYIIKIVAPSKRNRDAGVKELLLVLAPLAAIPLIGSAALTTFTAMFATSGYGKRRKRDLLTRELLSRSFTEVQPKVDDYVSQRIIGSQHNVGLESLLATSYSTATTGSDINTNAKRQPFPANDLIHTKIETSFGSTQTTPKSQVIRLKVLEDQNNWIPIDKNRDQRTGGSKLSHIMTNSNHSLENKNYKNVESLVKGIGKRFTQSMISSDQSLGKREALSKAQVEQNRTQVEPIEIQQYMSSAYLKSTDFRPDLIVKNISKSNESIFTKMDSNKKKNYRNFRDITDLGINFPIDMKSEESETIDKKIDFSNSDSTDTENDNKAKTDERRYEYNNWMPFLSNPYLVDIARGEGKREIQELDVIQKYLNAMGRPDYNDEIIATYLSCNGMLSASNQCLERLTCQFSDATSPMKQLEKDVSSLVIYSLLKNEHIDNNFKSRLQRAAFFGKDNPGKCNFYNCPKNKVNKNKRKKR